MLGVVLAVVVVESVCGGSILAGGLEGVEHLSEGISGGAAG